MSPSFCSRVLLRLRGRFFLGPVDDYPAADPDFLIEVAGGGSFDSSSRGYLAAISQGGLPEVLIGLFFKHLEKVI